MRAPPLGQDTVELIAGRLGLSHDDITRLLSAGTIG
jgi:hypothetical protein